MSRWKKFRYRLEYIGLLTGAWLVQRLPWQWLRSLGKCVGALVFFFDRKRHEVAFANLKAAFGETYNERERIEIAKKSYQIFAATMLELLWSPRLTPQIMDEIADIDVVDLRSSPQLEGVPAIYCCAHAANFEWTGQIAARYTSDLSLSSTEAANSSVAPVLAFGSLAPARLAPSGPAYSRPTRSFPASGASSSLSTLQACAPSTPRSSSTSANLKAGPNKFPVIAQKFKNPLIGKLFDRWRSSLGQEVIPQEQAMLKLFRYLKRGGKFGVLVDLNLKPQEGPVMVRMFDHLLTPLTRLPAELALRTGALLVPVECLIRPQGGYTLRFLEPLSVTSESTVESLTQAYWNVLESSIKRHPEYWLWTYKHWRYKPSQGESGFYPFYANTFPPFDELIN